MKALFIGGTGTISAAISERALALGWELTLLNRGNRSALTPTGAQVLKADIHDEEAVRAALGEQRFDVVADFIAYTPREAERDVRLFQGRVGQYFFISSASAYQKPLASPWITESTPLCNPFWQYSRDKIACEELLLRAYRETGFPVTVIRPSHTYSPRSFPLALRGPAGSFSVLERIRAGRKVIIPGDGLSLWTLTHCRDFAVAFCGLMGNLHAIGEAYHITSDESLTWNQIYRCAADALHTPLHAVHIASETLSALCPDFLGGLIGDKSNTVLFDNAKIKRAVPDFCASTRFDQGAREIVEYVYAHPECQQPDPAFDQWCDQVILRYERMAGELPPFSC